MKDSSIKKVAHNGVYDYDWIQNGYDVPISGVMEDTMTREGLINEYAGQYGLDACCLRHGVTGKTTTSLEEWWYSNGGKGNVMKNLILVPPDVRESYNEQDCKSTYELYHKQQSILEKPMRDGFSLTGINAVECKQFPVILQMKKNGIRVDLEKLRRETEARKAEYDIEIGKLYTEYGITSLTKKKGPGSILFALEQLGVDHELMDTKTGKSISADSLEKVNHPIIKTLKKIRMEETLLHKYLEGVFVKYMIRDKLHGTLKPTKRDDGGTVTGRYAASDPNLQNFTSRANRGGR